MLFILPLSLIVSARRSGKSSASNNHCCPVEPCRREYLRVPVVLFRLFRCNNLVFFAVQFSFYVFIIALLWSVWTTPTTNLSVTGYHRKGTLPCLPQLHSSLQKKARKFVNLMPAISTLFSVLRLIYMLGTMNWFLCFFDPGISYQCRFPRLHSENRMKKSWREVIWQTESNFSGSDWLKSLTKRSTLWKVHSYLCRYFCLVFKTILHFRSVYQGLSFQIVFNYSEIQERAARTCI